MAGHGCGPLGLFGVPGGPLGSKDLEEIDVQVKIGRSNGMPLKGMCLVKHLKILFLANDLP